MKNPSHLKCAYYDGRLRKKMTSLGRFLFDIGQINLYLAFWRSAISTSLDKWEVQILTLLQADATLTTAAIAESVGLSASPCWRRIERLEKEGFIRRKVVIVDRKKVGFSAQIFAQVKLSAHGRANLDEFTNAVRAIPEVLECYVLMGPVDFMLKIVAPDVEFYERLFFEKLSRLPGVQEINSTIALSEIKYTTAIPLSVK
jgi:Lrp/AsnC family transcriptional regulator